MKKRQKFSTIGALLCTSCLAVSVGVAALNVSAQTTTMPITSLISADSGVTVSKKDITATHYSRASTAETNKGTEYTYSGLAVESNVAYEGEFSGVFTGDTTIEYKFYGTTPWTSFKSLGTNIGDFYFTITSVADPTQWVQMNIIAGNPSLSEYTSYKTSTYFTGSTFGNKVLYFQNNVVQNKDLSAMSYGQGFGPTFLSDAIGVNEKLYIEVDDNDYMYLSYQQIDQGSNGVLSATATKVESITMVSLNGANTSTSAKMDWSEGYTISFGSNVDTTKTYKYSTSSATAPDGGTDVCFISLNGNALNTDTIQVTGETIGMLDDTVLDETETYTAFQGAEHTLYTVSNSSVYEGDYTCLDGTAKNGSFTMRGKTESGKLNTTELGNGKTFTVNGKTYTYNVVKGEKGTDLVGVNVETDGVSAEYQLHTGDNVASEYDGLTITADKAYTGNFDGTFNGNTALEYKFPGTTSLSTTSGDALGDFYFLIRSVNTPDNWIKIHITQRTANGALRADNALIYATTNLVKSNQSNYGYGLKSGAAATSFSPITQIITWNTVAPTFRSDASTVTEKLYIDTMDNGNVSVYYAQNGTKASAALITPEAVTGKVFDCSKGYTISFGSNFEDTQSFVKLKDGSTNVYEDYTGETPDAGTDVCFISVNGVKLNDSYNVISFNDSVSYDGNVVEGQADISAADADSKPFVVATTAKSDNGEYPLNYTKTAEVVWSKSNVSEDDGTLTLEAVTFGNRTVTVATNLSGKTYTLVVNGNSTEVKTSSDTVVLETQTMEGKAFIGWTISSLENKLYPANYEYMVVDGDTLTAVFVAFDMADGAGIRKTAPYGLRFVSGYNTADFAAIYEYATVGTLIVPTDTLGGKEINHTNFVANETMLDIAGTQKLSAEAAQKAVSEENYSADNTYYTGTISKLYEQNFARKFSARAYIKVTYADESEAYFYSDYDEANNARSAYDVAQKAKDNGETGTAIDMYISQTMDLTIADVNTTVYESETKITSVRVNGVWLSKANGAVVTVGETDYSVTYDYNETEKKLLLTFEVDA